MKIPQAGGLPGAGPAVIAVFVICWAPVLWPWHASKDEPLDELRWCHIHGVACSAWTLTLRPWLRISKAFNYINIRVQILFPFGGRVAEPNSSTRPSEGVPHLFYPFSSVQFSSRWYLCARKSPYALHPSLRRFPTTLPLKQLQCSSGWRRPSLALSKKIV